MLVLAGGRIGFDGSYNEAVVTNVINQVLQTIQQQQRRNNDEQSKPSKPKKKPGEPDPTELSNLARQTGEFAVYKYYFRSIGWRRVSVLLAAILIAVLCEVFESTSL